VRADLCDTLCLFVINRPDSHPRLWRYINLLLTYLLTYLYPTNKRSLIGLEMTE